MHKNLYTTLGPHHGRCLTRNVITRRYIIKLAKQLSVADVQRLARETQGLSGGDRAEVVRVNYQMQGGRGYDTNHCTHH
jgi:hypothetical protein